MTKSVSIRAALGVATALSLLALWNPASAQYLAEAPKKDPKSAANLYLLRNLEVTLVSWKSPDVGPDELRRWLLTSRIRLKSLMTAAQLYKRDALIVQAYGDTLQLLGEYDAFLKDSVFVDLTTDVARPNQLDELDLAGYVGRSAIEGGLAGAGTGTLVFPVVGTVAGWKVGTAVGAGKGFIEWGLEHRERVRENSDLDEKRRAAIVKLIDGLQSRFKANTAHLVDLAEALSTPKNYGWGSEVGFDGSMQKPFAEQLRTRPNDPFLHACIGVSESITDPRSAARRFIRAAELVPPDEDPDKDYFNLDRAAFLLSAARVAEHAARLSSVDAQQLAALSARCYEDARKCLRKKETSFPFEAKVIYARACALAGRTREADDLVLGFTRKEAENPWVYYECAGVKALLGDRAKAIDYLRRSFKALPRWQPCALVDSRLAALNATQKAEVERIVANPLIARWKGELGNNSLVIDFLPDGTMCQVYRGENKKYTYTEDSGNKLTTQRGDIQTTYSYKVTQTTLCLQAGGRTIELTRHISRLNGAWKYSANASVWFEFRPDGTWRGQSSNGLEKSGVYYLIPATAGSSAEVRCVYENLVLGSFERRFEYRAGSGGTLEMRPVGGTRWAAYERR